jgi:hypothetical protein
VELWGLNEKQKQLSLCASAKEIKTLNPINVAFIGGFNYEDFRFSQKTSGSDPLKIEGQL